MYNIKQRRYIFYLLILIFYTNAELRDFDDSFKHRYTSDQQRCSLKPEEIQRKFQNQILNNHNILRKRHCVSPLILDDKINENAQAYAEYLAKQDGRLVHSDRKGLLGENLYSTTTSNPIQNPDG